MMMTMMARTKRLVRKRARFPKCIATLDDFPTPRRATLRLREHAEASESEKDSSAGHEAAKSRRGEAMHLTESSQSA